MQKKILEDLELVVGRKFRDINELLEYLSEEFAKKLDKFDDAQEAYNDLNDDLDNLLGKYFVYSLGSEEWKVHIKEGDEYDENKLISDWNDYYFSCEKIIDINDLIDALNNRVSKDMSNVGCDCCSALRMICDEVFKEHPFEIYYGEYEPKISLLEI